MSQKALIYCRVSSERQKSEGHGLDSQEHRCREYAKAKNYEVEKVFADTFSGGGDFMRRSGMVSLLEHIDKHPHRNYVVVFDDLSRFARDVAAHIRLRQEFDRRDVRIECPNFKFEDTPEGELVETIMAAQNQYHRQSNRRQVIQKQKARLESGYWPFYPIRGYKAERISGQGKVLMQTGEAEVLKEALEGYASGRFPDKADVWRFLRHKQFNGKQPVYMQAVNRLLDRAAMYAGFVEYPDWDVSRRKGAHQGIISVDTLQRIENKLAGNSRTMNRQDINPDFPARGYVVCSECLRPMTASWTTKPKKNYRRAFYRCNTKGCARQHKSTHADLLDVRLGEVLRSLTPKEQTVALARAILNDVWEQKNRDRATSQKQSHDEYTETQKTIARLTSRITRATSEKVIKAYESELEKLQSKADELQSTLAGTDTSIDFGTALDVVLAFLQNPYVYWENGGLYEKRLALKLVFSGKLPYHFENGFGTTEVCSVLKVFELIGAQKLQDVEIPERY